MKETRVLLPVFLLVIGFAFVGAPGHGQTADGETPAEETVCDVLSGAAFGLCNAYCEAMDCELLDDGDDTTFPNASEQACLQVKDNFIRITGEAVLPCDCPADGGQLGCPCDLDEDCEVGLVCDTGDDGGMCIDDDGSGV